MPLNPPRDDNGNVLPHDDNKIPPQSMLVRRINKEEHVIFDENLQAMRIKSAAFSRSSGDPHYGMSINIGHLLEEKGLPASHTVPDGMGAVKLKVSDVRNECLCVGSDPLPDNEFHGQVWGVKDSKRTKLHKLVVDWVVPIEGVLLR